MADSKLSTLEANVAKALNKAVLLLGIPWQWAATDLVIGSVVFEFASKTAGLLFLVPAVLVSRWLYKREPRFRKAITLWWRFGRFGYDAGHRNVKHLPGIIRPKAVSKLRDLKDGTNV